MSVRISLCSATHHCSFVPLAVVGYCLTRSGLLKPLWSELDFDLKTLQHTPTDKLQDVLVAILAGCRSLAQVNTHLRSEPVLATAWHRPQFAEQSTVSRTLDALQDQNVHQLRAGHLKLWQQHTQLRQHRWKQPLILDVDPTSLITSKHAQDSRKGWVSGKKTSTAATSCASRWQVITRAFCHWPMRVIVTGMNISNQLSSIC